MNKNRVIRREDKSRRRANEAFKVFVAMYGKEINKFAIGAFGTALTLYRDGKMNDTDVDFVLKRENVGFLMDFLNKNKLHVSECYVEKKTKKISEIKIMFMKMNFDFFVIDTYFGIESVTISYGNLHTKKQHILIQEQSKKEIKTKKINGINIYADELIFKKWYGTGWKIPKIYSFDFKEEMYDGKTTIKDKKMIKKYKVLAKIRTTYNVRRNKLK